MVEALGAGRPMAPAIASPAGERVTSYGFLPYWTTDPLSVDFDSLTHVAYFRVGLSAGGTPTDTSGWNTLAEDLVEAAHAVGTKVHLTVAVFDAATQNSVLGNATNRANAVSSLADLVNDYGADGVNVDFESTPFGQKDNLVAFVEELKAVVDEVYVDTPAVDWDGAYDYDQLAEISDGLFIMGYDFHWDGGDPGPVAPLFGGSPWSVYALDWTLEDYRTWGATDDKIVLGLPLYGREWPSATDAVPGTASSDGYSWSIGEAMARASDFSPTRFEDTSQTAWVFTGESQLWYDDYGTLETKLSWGVDQGIQGVGYWALGYEGNDPEFWAMVDRVTLTPEDTGAPEDTGTLDTGLADTGESGTSSGGSSWSVETDVEEKPSGCACATASQPQTGWLLLPLLGLLTARRRR
jgi:MYXO-CTERM domain-containing protein